MIITVEGNIGAGKTSFTKALYEKIKKSGKPVVYIPEPVDAWKNVAGQNLLQMMYDDRKRWAFTFQVNAFLHMTRCDVQAYEYSSKGITVIRERSSCSARNIFIPHVSEHVSDAEKEVLKQLCATVSSPLTVGFDESGRWRNVTIYLRTDPKTCYERVNARGRPEEANGRVDLATLEKLHELHETQLAEGFEQDHVIVGDGNDFEIADPTSVKIFGNSTNRVWTAIF